MVGIAGRSAAAFMYSRGGNSSLFRSLKGELPDAFQNNAAERTAVNTFGGRAEEVMESTKVVRSLLALLLAVEGKRGENLRL